MKRDLCSAVLAALVLVGNAAAGEPGPVTETQLPPSDAQYPAQPVDDDESESLEALGLTGLPTDIAEPPDAPVPPPMATEAPERVIWKGEPIPLMLGVGQERMIHFPSEVNVGWVGGRPPGLRTLKVGGTVYWLAREPFEPVRTRVYEKSNGRTYLFDLSATADAGAASAAPLQVMLAPVGVDGVDTVRAEEPPAALPPRADYVQLTRFASRQLYGPPRLAATLPGTHRIPVRSKPVPLVRGSQVQAEPLVSWRSGDTFVTAVKLHNVTRTALTLDPRGLRGAWLAATFQHARLFPAGDEADTTCVYLLSSRPFHEAFRAHYGGMK